jgi:hypothetical protein
MVNERPATIDELPYLQQRINESGGEKIKLYEDVYGEIVPISQVWVAEKDGKIIGLINLRLIWQAEPCYIFPEVKDTNTRRRAAIGLPRAMEAWLGDRTKNKTGIYSYFFVTLSRAWARLAIHFGCSRIYSRHITLGKDL